MSLIAVPGRVGASTKNGKLHLRLYTGHRTFDTKAAIGQVHTLLESLEGSYELEVLKGDEYREMARQDQAPFMPMLIRVSPAPVIRLSMPQANREELKRQLLDSVTTNERQ